MKKRSRELPLKKQTLIATLSHHSAASLIKHLASCNDTVRFHSLRLLQTSLTSLPPTSETSPEIDMKKLWKGLFYTLWHCDKAPAQSDLINRLSSLVTCLSPDLALNYFEIFLITLRREWSGIDHLRLDKFYLCIRRFVKCMFVFLRKRDWDLGLLEKFVEVLEVKCFLADDKLLGNGVGYHVVGVFVEEMKGCFVPVRKEVVELVFRPFFSVMERGLDKVLVGKVKGLVFEELLRVGERLLSDGEDGYDEVAFGVIAMKMGFAGRFYEIGSSEGCVQGNRKVVLKLHEEFVKLEKRFELAGVEIEVPDVVVEEDEEEVPELIPIGSSEVNLNGSVVDGNGEAEEGEDVVDDVADARKRKKMRKESDGTIKEKKIKKRKEKNNQILDENSSLVTENLVEGSLMDESKSSAKKRKKKEKNNQPLDENTSVPEDSALVTENLVEAGLASSAKKSKKKEKKNEVVLETSLSAPVDVALVNESSEEQESNGNVMNESVIANLQKQFENVAAELGSDDDDDDADFSLSDAFASICDKQPAKKKKKKRAKSCGTQNLVNEGDGGVSAAKSVDGSAKKVRFAMKNNLVWKPHSPLPPQSLRIPPSVTPRGSALKKGVLPGPIKEVSPGKKKLKKKMQMKSAPWR